jgi:hypothetical protein
MWVFDTMLIFVICLTDHISWPLQTARPAKIGDISVADPTIFDYLIQDDQGLKNRSAIYVAYNGATATVDSLIGSWLEVGALIDPCIDGEIVQGQITIPLQKDPAWKAAPVVGSNVNQVMTLNFENDFNRYLTPMLLPSYKESTLIGNRTPNVGANPLLALINFMIAGGSDLFPNSRDLHDLDALRDAFLTVRKVRNQRQRTSTIS